MIVNGSRHRKLSRHGLATVELALVLPLLLLVVIGTLDYGYRLFIMHNMNMAARDGARNLAVRGVSAAEAQALTLGRLSNINAPFTVEAIGPLTNGDVTIRISVPVKDISLGFLPVGKDDKMQTSITMRKEGS
jgi:Flp pilus assembly protein TadG